MPTAVATSASEMPAITAAEPPVPPASTSTPRSLKERMMPATVPKRPTKGVVEPMVASSHRLRRSLRPTWARSRSTADSMPLPPLARLRSQRSKPARKMSAATASERSAAVRAAATSPRSRCLLTISPRLRERSLTPQRAMSLSMATPRATTEAPRRRARVTPPRRR
ncbi:hypothetical protein COSO111634_38385 [Corallococcus soli]